MTVTLTYRNQTYEVEDAQTVREAISKIGLEPEQYLVIRTGQMLTVDQPLEPDDSLKLVAIVAGGAR